MSKSYKRTPVIPFCTGSNRNWQLSERRRARRIAALIAKQDEGDAIYPHKEQFADPWMSPTDGKKYWKDAEPKHLRK